ncbi:hypothetical protein [Nocardioides daejeonensis]|uniref:hypothetical protein n=1 Tax=Nocardioides daejeonensis TaxID=1046556 RepID=UPI0013A55A2D|nr:hypothetical protein [Nocardioides daejeonensis]
MGSRSSDRRPLLGSLLLVLALVVGCAVSEPEPADWSESSARALESAASAVATARLALSGEKDGDLWRSYAVVLLADAEEAAGSAADQVAVVQTPRGREKRAEQVRDLLGRAEDAVRAARQELVAGKPITAERLARLERLRQRLLREAGR